ncbi:hypothetical protein NQZ68_032486 [Dissostichus eleginoides]|nr:hypothetical protein NQZ68_032486 [Dissostichus eleginoides]
MYRLSPKNPYFKKQGLKLGKTVVRTVKQESRLKQTKTGVEQKLKVFQLLKTRAQTDSCCHAVKQSSPALRFITFEATPVAAVKFPSVRLTETARHLPAQQQQGQPSPGRNAHSQCFMGNVVKGGAPLF